nr:MAG TPA: Serine dehydrogenase proteinase [Caudoviricetes sp.]
MEGSSRHTNQIINSNMLNPIDNQIRNLLKSGLETLEQQLDSDIYTYYGPIDDSIVPLIKHTIEQIAKEKKHTRLSIVLTTGGGSATAVERYVNIIRNFYNEVNFIVPDFAYSAGTIFCMSGDNIYMNYYSVLGPIDPQVMNKDRRWVPALGYLDKINELIGKAHDKTLTDAEFLILKDFDLAELKGYEQAKELTIDLLKKWLVKYKFKNWTKKQTSGVPVTQEMKEKRAEEIADRLSDNKIWKSHGRPINIEILRDSLNLVIEDYGKDSNLSTNIDSYYSLLDDYVRKNGSQLFIQTRNFL